MAWIGLNTAGDAPSNDASKVEISKTVAKSLAASADIPQYVAITDNTSSGDGTTTLRLTGYKHVRIVATTTTTVTEYRGLTETAALALVNENNSFNKSDYTSSTDSTYGVTKLVGDEVHAEARRVNEARGWTVTVTKTSTTAEG